MRRTTICGEFREGDDYKECQIPHHNIAMTGAAGRAFTHFNIHYTLFHSLPIQSFDSTWVKTSWFSKKSWVLLMALLPHIWCFGVRYCKKNLVTKSALVNNFDQPCILGSFSMLLSLSLYLPSAFFPMVLHAEPRNYPGLRDQLWLRSFTKKHSAVCVRTPTYPGLRDQHWLRSFTKKNSAVCVRTRTVNVNTFQLLPSFV